MSAAKGSLVARRSADGGIGGENGCCGVALAPGCGEQGGAGGDCAERLEEAEAEWWRGSGGDESFLRGTMYFGTSTG
jgi:hypothetical protein